MDKKIEVNKNPNVEVPIEDPALAKKQKAGMIAGVIVIIFAGILSGYFLSGAKGTGPSGTSGTVNSEKVVGSTNTQEYPDLAEGTLEVGGIDGEGTHRLIRPGGDSQTVYLTSSVVDLDQFVGKEVKVWGETHTAQKAGWFMDVGRVEVK
ncbi:hypothetical protein HYT02_04720 [Candidatus Gottesmanbacteria bacterium]|nr:hypothetical protein [Candidatus Gottesmanbacteria bacterium]